MNTLHFKYAVEVERTGSITQAAENLYMGQPNLSKAIMELESTLGFRIFDRTSKGAVPTEKGKRFLAYAKNVLLQIEHMEELSDEGNTPLTLSLIFSRSGYIAAAVGRYVSSLSASERIRFNIRETNAVQVIAGVASGQFNLGIVRFKLSHERYFTDYIADKELDAIPFWEFDGRVIESAGNHRSDEVLTYLHLSNMTPLVYGDETIPYLSFGEVRREAKSKAAKRAVFVYDRGTALELLSSMPNAYMLSSPAPAAELEKHALVQTKCDIPGERYRDVILFPKGYKFTEAERRFIDLLSEVKNQAEFAF